MIKVEIPDDDRISQGDIYRDVEFIESVTEKDGVVEIRKITFPYVAVLTQDCDLAQDFSFRFEDLRSEDKLLLSVLVAPLYNEDHFFLGEHLSEINRKMQEIKKKKKGDLTTAAKNILDNNNPRYHYLKFSENVPIVPSIIDFKHYFSLNVEYLLDIRDTNFVCKISELYREDLSHRFAGFLSRIGLPS